MQPHKFPPSLHFTQVYVTHTPDHISDALHTSLMSRPRAATPISTFSTFHRYRLRTLPTTYHTHLTSLMFRPRAATSISTFSTFHRYMLRTPDHISHPLHVFDVQTTCSHAYFHLLYISQVYVTHTPDHISQPLYVFDVQTTCSHAYFHLLYISQV